MFVSLFAPVVLFLSLCEGGGNTNGRTLCTRPHKQCGERCVWDESNSRLHGICSKNEVCLRGNHFLEPANMCEEDLDPCWGTPGDRKTRKRACKDRGAPCIWNGNMQICQTKAPKHIDDCQNQAKTQKECKKLFKTDEFQNCRWNKVDLQCYDSKWDCTNAEDRTQCNRFRNKVNPNCQWVERNAPSSVIKKLGKYYCKDTKWDPERTTPTDQTDPDCAVHDFRRCGKDERCFWNKDTKKCY